MRILIAIDGSQFSQAAVEQVIALVSPHNVEVRLLHIIELWPVYFHSPAWDSEIPNVRREKREEAEKLLAHTAQQLRAAGFNVTTIAKEGDPKADVIDVAVEWHADLVILGSHGRKGLDRFLVGSVSEAVARHAPCSVQIVRIHTETPMRLSVNSKESRKNVSVTGGTTQPTTVSQPKRRKGICNVCGKLSGNRICRTCADRIRAEAVARKKREDKGEE